ncbi:hypothetical protein MKEN_01078500 [Mycena kentingensis (nom. inval.)]|nr:hypothetical protein MKEN_01078500 [Mycena kentingensis (nom. inval.)]
MNSPSADLPRRRAPPFPEIPPGATVIAFKDFRECGIALPAEGTEHDGIERDTLGIPTITLRAKHDTDVSKSMPEKKRTPRDWAQSRPNFSKSWWNDWEVSEDLRNHGPYNSSVGTIDRFQQAASDFQKYRKFPPYATKVQYMWDQFKIFSGLLGTTPVWHNVSESPKNEDSDDGAESDFEDGLPSRQLQNQAGPGEKRFPPRVRPRAPYELFGKRPTIVHGNDEVKALLDAAKANKNQRALAFLEDPGRYIQLFLSSYMLNEGLAWEDRHLINAPHLLKFFVRFLLRNNVFLPEPAIETSLRAALPVIENAMHELPRTAQLGKLCPDDFALSCREVWGRKIDFVFDSSDTESEPSALADSKVATGDHEFQDALNVELLDTDKVAQDAPTEVEWWNDQDPSSFTAGGNNGPTWSASAQRVAAVLSKLGPTALPLTHEPGIVEKSVRRVMSILAPESYPNENEVEKALQKELGMWRVVLEPWLDWAEAESSDAVADSDYVSPRVLGCSHIPSVHEHDPLKTPITLLVDKPAAEKLCIGMGLGGTWVQLARVEDFEDVQKQYGERLWYCEELGMVLPSYWIASV